MAKYFGHKPQWRRGTTPRPAPVLDFNRDFRSGEFQFSGPVYTPDPRSAPGRVPQVPRQKGQRNWGSPVNFNPRAGSEAAKKRAFYRNLGRGIGGITRGAQFAFDLYEMYDDVQRSLGGEPYTIGGESPLNGGPKGDEFTTPDPDNPGQYFTFPTPDGGPMATEVGGYGWTLEIHERFYSATRGYNDTPPYWRWRPHDGFTGPFPNHNAEYPIAEAEAFPNPRFDRWAGWEMISFSWPAEAGNELENPPVWDGTLWERYLGWQLRRPGWGPYEHGPNPGIVISDGTPQGISDNWPTVGTRLRTVLPWPQWTPGPAWSLIPARNRLRAQFPEIRQESYGPPLTPNKPGGVIHKPPGPGVVESKRRTNSQALLWWYRAAKKAWHETGEYCDRVDAIYEALPQDAKIPYRKGRPISCADKTARLLQNLHRVDMNEAIKNLVVNEIEDRIIGAGFKSLDEAARKLGIPGWRVDLGMQGNVEAAIEFLFEIKKALTP